MWIPQSKYHGAIDHVFQTIQDTSLSYKQIPSSNGCSHTKAIPRKVGWVAGACMMVRRVEYLTIGGLSEKLEFYGEEPEFGYRSYKLHYQTWYYPDAEIIHLGGQSTQKETIHTEDEVRLRRYALLQKRLWDIKLR